MLLTISTTHKPATDLGFLLYKHPDRFQTFEVPWGRAHVFYPEANEERCEVALLLDLDPVGLVRAKDQHGSAPLSQYVNDRPYVVSSFFSVALAKVFGTALSGNSRERPDLVETAIPLEATMPVVPGNPAIIEELFRPLGYEVEASRLPLDEQFPNWGESRYCAVKLRATVRLTDLLSHLYVLLPVLDGQKHYWVGRDELEKLLRHGEGWLDDHPARELIARRYLQRRHRLVQEALDRLREIEDEPDELELADEEDQARPVPLGKERIEVVAEKLLAVGARRVVDLGCSEGKLVARLIGEAQVDEIVGMDVSPRTLDIAERRLKLDRRPEFQARKVRLLQGSLFYRDERLEGYDAAAVVEVVEHLDPPRLEAFERVLFGCTRPRAVVLTTPNAEYNVVWESLPAGQFRHGDHRFEWTRSEFEGWCRAIGDRWGYDPELFGIGAASTDHGQPTQGAVFRRGGP